jgi:ABC-type multidrug transport system fused ATPase/permease subunit
MERSAVGILFLFFLLLGLPLLGVFLAGEPVSRYLEFPPQTRYVEHAPFSWPVFAGFALFLLITILPLVIRGIQGGRPRGGGRSSFRPFPWWGVLGLALGLVFWVLAWTRFPWFSRFQPHTFFPLWISFILVMNALTFRRDGRCMMLDRPTFFLLLFPLSALFWWFFEYFNRFVQNWHYMGVQLGAWEYLFFATLSFSTVLPGVLSAREWIQTWPRLQGAFTNYVQIKPPHPRALAWVTLLLSALGLAGIGVRPNALFPLLWVSPVLIIISLQQLMGEDHLFSRLSRGDWSVVASSALAATLCGFFWEMWNFYSLTRWEYTVPYVDRFHLFEMPVLGYGGYVPFGLLCAVVGERMGAGIARRKGRPRAGS